MKLLFLCSSLGLGVDGVGDYAWQLGLALKQLGHEVRVLSLNDRHLDGVVEEKQGELAALRLSSTIDWPAREQRAHAYVKAFNPDWVSIQFVCYGWHPKGVPIGLCRRLERTLGAVPLHLMFHELTIGVTVESTLRHRIVGRLQREFAIKPLTRLPQVRVIHTNTWPHAQLLQRWGAAAEVLPLFGNIPFSPTTEKERELWWQARFTFARDQAYVAGSFGYLAADCLNDEFIAVLVHTARVRGKQLVVACAGKLGNQGERYFAAKSQQYGGEVRFVSLGALPAHEVSVYMSLLDLGIAAAAPWLYIGKSSSVATMLDHGLPVAVSHRDINVPGIASNGICGDELQQLRSQTQPGFREWLVTAARRPARERRMETASRLVAALSAVTSPSGAGEQVQRQ